MSALSRQFEANQFPLPFTSFSVVSAELAGYGKLVNDQRTDCLRERLRTWQVAFIEASGVYEGTHETCFVLLGTGHCETARLAALGFQQQSYLVVFDAIATEHYSANNSSKRLPEWRIVNPNVDPCLAIPGMPAIQFYSEVV